MPINYKEYPDNWKTEIRPAILKRANNCCEECGISNHSIIIRLPRNQWRYINSVEYDMIRSKIVNSLYSKKGAIKKLGFTEIVLTIAHMDHDKLNHDVNLDRLKALCQKCHLKYDINHHTQNRKYGRNHKRDQTTLEFPKSSIG